MEISVNTGKESKSILSQFAKDCRRLYYGWAIHRAAWRTGSKLSDVRARGRRQLEDLIEPVRKFGEDGRDLFDDLWEAMAFAQTCMDKYGDYDGDSPGTFRRRFAYKYMQIAPEDRWGPESIAEAVSFRDLTGRDAESGIKQILEQEEFEREGRPRTIKEPESRAGLMRAIRAIQSFYLNNGHLRVTRAAMDGVYEALLWSLEHSDVDGATLHYVSMQLQMECLYEQAPRKDTVIFCVKEVMESRKKLGAAKAWEVDVTLRALGDVFFEKKLRAGERQLVSVLNGHLEQIFNEFNLHSHEVWSHGEVSEENL